MSSTGIIDTKPGFKLTPATASGIVLMIGICGLFYYPLHYIHAEQVTHPALSFALPPVAVVWIAVMIPLFMFIAYPEDYKRLNPLNPLHFFYIARKSYRALGQNNLKVGVKDM